MRGGWQGELAGDGAVLVRQLAGRYGLRNIGLRQLSTPVNDVMAVSSDAGEFALKLYHRNRGLVAVQWEVDLLLHLHRAGAPVMQPIRGRNGYVEQFYVDGRPRLAVLSPWAPGSKPVPAPDIYGLLGEAAGRIHRAAAGFPSSVARESYDAAVLVDQQLHRMMQLLVEARCWHAAVGLAGRLNSRLTDATLDWGICHMDLTLDNVHLAEGLTVFDFDSAGTCWRAVEPSGVLRFSATYFQAWLEGYRTVRPFSAADEAAVAVFGIVAEMRAVVWKLGMATSSRGAPSLGVRDLPAVVDGWLAWEANHLRES